MNLKKAFFASVALLVLSGGIPSARADGLAVPSVVSFTLSPDTIDSSSASTPVTFDLIVNCAGGIFSSQDLVTLTNRANFTVVFPINRVDSPINLALQTVEFKGSYTVPPTLLAGPYYATAAPVVGIGLNGNAGYSTSPSTASSSSKVQGAENSLLIRTGGDLNFAYTTFAGPAFKKSQTNTFISPKFYSVPAPVWKVGETIDLRNYYEVKVQGLALNTNSKTPAVCKSENTSLVLISTGNCEFIVYTNKTLDYQYKEDDEIVAISPGRFKPSYVVGTIPTQSSNVLPLIIPGPIVYGPYGVVLPTSDTPAVCYSTGTFINVISGGTCRVFYSTPESAEYQASDATPLTFQITRDPQTVNFKIPTTAPLTRRQLTLVATASSGMPVTFQTHSGEICSVTGNSLNLLMAGACQVEAIQAGSTRVAPVSVTQSISVLGASPASKVGQTRRIICLKNGMKKTFAGSHCPAGFKAKK